MPYPPADSSILFKNTSIWGPRQSCDESLKVNQCMGIYVESSVVSVRRREAEPGEALTIDYRYGHHFDYVFVRHAPQIRGCQDNAIDYVAVQYGHILNSDISNSDYCIYFKVSISAHHGVICLILSLTVQ